MSLSKKRRAEQAAAREAQEARTTQEVTEEAARMLRKAEEAARMLQELRELQELAREAAQIEAALKQREPALQAQRRGLAAIDALALLVPKRLAEEDIGDAMELISRLVDDGKPAWQIYLKTASAFLWVSMNAVREVMGSLFGRSNKPSPK